MSHTARVDNGHKKAPWTGGAKVPVVLLPMSGKYEKTDNTSLTKLIIVDQF